MEKIKQKKKKEILFIGHLQEKNDLKKWERDAPLANTEKNKEDLNKIVDAITLKVKESGKKAVMFISSPKIRAKETAGLAGTEIKKRLGENIKIRYSIDENLKPNEQGKFILPEGYNSGSFFEGLNIASKIFIKESLEQSHKNLHYRFGDPVILSNGSYKYPELAKYFKVSGETYAESLIRIFSSVIQMSQKVNKLNSSVEVVIISHGFNFHILKGLSILSEQIKKGEMIINTGEIANKIWEIYKNNTTNFKSLAYLPIDITNLGDKELIKFLSREIEYLKK